MYVIFDWFRFSPCGRSSKRLYSAQTPNLCIDRLPNLDLSFRRDLRRGEYAYLFARYIGIKNCPSFTYVCM